MISLFELILTTLIFLLGIRTVLWHLQNWQIREYRWDRLKAYFSTRDGRKNIWNLWFFRGILPRPHKSGRVFMILGIFIFITDLFFLESYSIFSFLSERLTFSSALVLSVFIWERTIWLTLGVSVFLSKFPVWGAQKIIFYKAKKIILNSKNSIRIGITGSYGKSSTKEILVHLLTSKFGKENVLFNPENQNNEVAIARLILKNRTFFKNPPLTPPLQKERDKKFFVVEIGAYRLGEIKKVCQFTQPHIGILTGINAQHIALFGSQKNIQHAKFELAENTSNKVFFNADSLLLQEIFDDRNIKAVKIPIVSSNIQAIKTTLEKTEFTLYGKPMILPWGGEFFVQNAILASETARELGLSPQEIKQALSTLPPLKRALSIKKHASGAIILSDLYSANPDGVIRAIEHLGKTKKKKIFIGMPLRELGKESLAIHKGIFETLAQIKADVFWLKPDFEDLGEKICGKYFHHGNISKLKKMVSQLKKDDAILLESRLPENITKLFS